MRDLKKELSGRAGFITAFSAMIKGLKNQEKREDFTINMGSYGEVYSNNDIDQKICAGCAATCAIQEYFGINFDADNIYQRYHRADAVGVDFNTIIKLETAIEDLRTGSVRVLSDYCGLGKADNEFVRRKVVQLPMLFNRSWERALPYYKTALDEIMAAWGITQKALA